MTSLATQVKASLLSHGEQNISEQNISEQSSEQVCPQPLPTIEQPSHLSLDCAVQTLPNESGLCARLSYNLPTQVLVSLAHVFSDAKALNQRLASSRVFVVQDLDGDRGYYLRMDTVQMGRVNAENIAKLLDAVTKDVSILLAYYRTAGS